MEDPKRLLDECEIKGEFRRLYREKGFAVMLQVLHELVLSSQYCAEVMNEERLREIEEKD